MIRLAMLLLGAAVIVLPAIARAGTPGNPMAGYDVLHYDLHLDFTMRDKSFRGSVGVTATALENIGEILLDASSDYLVVDSVYSGDVKMDFAHAKNTLLVSFQESIPSHSRFAVSVFYHGRSGYRGTYDGGGVYFMPAGRLATISEPNFARTWWPCKDQPSDKATAHITVTVPDSLIAVSNGILKDVNHTAGTKTYSWETNYPIATYLVSVAAAPYVHFSESYSADNGLTMPIDYFVYPEDSARAGNDFRNTSRILRFFSRTFLEYPFIREKFGLAEVDGDLTMEHQTVCSIQKSMITGERTYETTIVHETAHQWWGNFITPSNWKHTWLSEGFATYAEALYIEETEGKDSAAEYVRRWMGSEQGIYAGSVIGKTDTAFWDSFAPRVYNKGAIVLHMLRGVTGDSLFFAIMRNYLTNPAYAYGNATTENFMAECEHVTGGSMKWFFDEWVYNDPGSIDRPEYRYRWNATKEGDAYRVTVHLDQPTAARQLYRMPMMVTIICDTLRANHTIDNTLPSQSFTFTSKNKPTEVLIDPEGKIMKILLHERFR